jgi:hypothetical protein
MAHTEDAWMPIFMAVKLKTALLPIQLAIQFAR